MEFYSYSFVIFFTAFYLLYWSISNRVKLQNVLVLAGSCAFYAWWDWRFLGLLAASAVLNYCLGIGISKTENEKLKSFYVYLSLLQGLGGLLFFKYYNFFISSLVEGLAAINVDLHASTLNLILPLGISFYTFRTISYVIDVNNEKIDPTKDFVVFFNYVAFFPCVLAGPIDRANRLIPQFENKRQFDYAKTVDGLRQILWGLFKKLVIADNCAMITDEIFSNYATLPASTLWIGAFLYLIQLYADFSGYSDMAIGFSRLLGFDIIKNFNFPFFAQNIADFWQRWHISLTGWMTEYVFTPLSFLLRDYAKTGMVIAITINFVLVGLWHGANWTFVVFGLLNGIYFIPLVLSGAMNKRQSLPKNSKLPTLKQSMKIVGTFLLVMVTAILLRADSIQHAAGYYTSMIAKSVFAKPQIQSGMLMVVILMVFILIMMTVEWLQKDNDHGFHGSLLSRTKSIRWATYFATLLVIFIFGVVSQQFIYLRF